MTTVDDYLSTTEITGALTPEQAAQVMDLAQEGDTAPVADLAGAPAPAPAEPAAEPTTTTTTTTTTEAPEPEPAILAKDGKHLIPFDKLAEARESAQRAAAERDEALRRAVELQAELDAAKAPPKEDPQKVDLTALRRDRYNAMLDGDVEKAIQIDEKIDAEVQRAAEEKAARRAKEDTSVAALEAALEQVAQDARTKYPALDHNSDKADKDAIDFVVFRRDSLVAQGELPHKALAQAVDSAAKLFRWSDGQPAATAPTPDPKSAAAAAAAAIAAAKAPVPASLSDIPGGKPGGLSSLEQLAGKANGPDLLDAMSNMSRTQIEEFLNRSL